MTSAEREYLESLESVGADVFDCLVHVYQELAIHHIAGSDPDMRDALETRVAFFTAILSAHQTAGFVALHRLYETKAAHQNLSTLLGATQRNLNLFTREAWAARRRERGVHEQAIAAQTPGLYVPTAETLEPLWRLAGEGRKLYLAAAMDIRHQIFGHTGAGSLAERVRLFERLMVRDLERMAVIPHVIHSALKYLFEFGREPALQIP
jgi:hypothetical protein